MALRHESGRLPMTSAVHHMDDTGCSKRLMPDREVQWKGRPCRPTGQVEVSSRRK